MNLSKKNVAALLLILAGTGYLAMAETPLDHLLIKQVASQTPAPPFIQHTSSAAATEAALADPKAALENALTAMIDANRPGATAEERDGQLIITNVTSMLVLVNKERRLPSDYTPPDLVVPDVPFSFSGDHPKKQLRQPAARALERLFARAETEGIELKAVSGYRSYATQQAIFERNARDKGEAEANRTSAYPGESEHQTGLAMDVSSGSVNYGLVKSFGQTKEGKWLSEHAHEFGFIIRYGEGQEEETGYAYEPWHLRFVGVDAATRIVEKDFILETFLEA
ncbi:D-alanyl-D-alanine carboxypeptidase family protein [Paenibacillus sp. 1P07SE]|uniref:M15 family metallopeptidase n=1 Tax=Paenibacillus sp. 1P07SE TaxID=3132209 RepID=UPI0039A4080E